jgi:methionyl-tRNA formyltransferase
MTAAASGPAWISGRDTKAEMRVEARRRFADAVRSYDALPARLVHRDVDVHTEGPAILERLGPDVVVVLGGPVYPREFIESAPLVLNFHSGISPVYNGTATIQFAFANGHPHLCGGTLMKMSSVVDGGSILGHFLPKVESGDTPASLFMKTAAGATTLYDRVLGALATGSKLSSAPQAQPLFYYRGLNWTLYQSLQTRRQIQRDIASKYARPERIVEYWQEPDDSTASAALDATIRGLLWR